MHRDGRGIITPEGRRVVSHGFTSRQDGRPVDGDTAFEIASVTKAFTSLLLTEMVGRGEVALDDPVAAYLPAHVRMPQRKGRQITLVDLATHTSGLPPQPPDLLGLDDPNARTYSLEQLYSSLSGYRLTRDIGSEWEHGNLDMAILGHALTRRAGIAYETLLRTRVTEPIGLSPTSTVAASLEPNIAVSHDSDLRPTDRLALGALAPAGSLLSSANDLLTLLGASLGIVPSPVAPALQAMSRTRRPMQPPLLTRVRRYGRVMLATGLLAPPAEPYVPGAPAVTPASAAMAPSVSSAGPTRNITRTMAANTSVTSALRRRGLIAAPLTETKALFSFKQLTSMP